MCVFIAVGHNYVYVKHLYWRVETPPIFFLFVCVFNIGFPLLYFPPFQYMFCYCVVLYMRWNFVLSFQTIYFAFLVLTIRLSSYDVFYIYDFMKNRKKWLAEKFLFLFVWKEITLLLFFYCLQLYCVSVFSFFNPPPFKLFFNIVYLIIYLEIMNLVKRDFVKKLITENSFFQF